MVDRSVADADNEDHTSGRPVLRRNPPRRGGVGSGVRTLAQATASKRVLIAYGVQTRSTCGELPTPAAATSFCLPFVIPYPRLAQRWRAGA